jgi:hypothetical protein
MSETKTLKIASKKSVVVALILTFLFGSLGLLYSSVVHKNQMANDKPLVSLMVWDKKGKEGSDSGEFRIYQSGKIISNLTVYYTVTGTAKRLLFRTTNCLIFSFRNLQ